MDEVLEVLAGVNSIHLFPPACEECDQYPLIIK